MDMELVNYHTEAALSPMELEKCDRVAPDNTIQKYVRTDDLRLDLSHIQSFRQWWISAEDWTDISFATIVETKEDNDFPRYGFIEGGCDYTGWGCQSGASLIFADELPRLVTWALGQEDRDRWGLTTATG